MKITATDRFLAQPAVIFRFVKNSIIECYHLNVVHFSLLWIIQVSVLESIHLESYPRLFFFLIFGRRCFLDEKAYHDKALVTMRPLPSLSGCERSSTTI